MKVKRTMKTSLKTTEIVRRLNLRLASVKKKLQILFKLKLVVDLTSSLIGVVAKTTILMAI